MPSALTPLANITLGSSAATVTFSSVSQSYRDLMLVVQLQTNTGTASAKITFNGDTAANYPYVYMGGDGATASSGSGTQSYVYTAAISYINSTAWWGGNIQIMDYNSTDKHKTSLVRANAAGLGTEAIVSRWANTAAITTVAVTCSANQFAAGSTFALYGIASA